MLYIYIYTHIYIYIYKITAYYPDDETAAAPEGAALSVADHGQVSLPERGRTHIYIYVYIYIYMYLFICIFIFRHV